MKHRLDMPGHTLSQAVIGYQVKIGHDIVGTVVAINAAESYIEYEDGQARRDGNGSLMCDGCEQPFPYAEPVDGKFICYGCRSFH